MNENDFADLAESIRQAGAIRRGEQPPNRRFEMEPPDIKAIRERLNQSQREFAQMIGISVATLQNWEQGRRRPDGPARALLQVAERHPEVVREALSPPEPF
jgi:putative transcriptional regulator